MLVVSTGHSVWCERLITNESSVMLPGDASYRMDDLPELPHSATLRRIYGNHWSARRLAERDNILSAPAAISIAFDCERRRVAARIKRLTRSRNAATYSGSWLEAACGTISDHAVTLAQEALNTVIRAIVTGEQLDDHPASRRDEHRQRKAFSVRQRPQQNISQGPCSEWRRVHSVA